MRYLLDANIFIEPAKRWYHPDICPGFWDWLEHAFETGIVTSIEDIHEEVSRGNDQARDFVVDRLTKAKFLRFDAHDQLSKVTQAVQAARTTIGKQRYLQAAINDYAGKTDCKLVAMAFAHNDAIITLEKPGNSNKNIKMADVCDLLVIKQTLLFDLLRQHNVRFSRQ
jgi:hypothetical protein